MKDAARVAEQIRDEAERHADPKELRAAVLEILRRAFDGLAPEEVPGALAAVRDLLAPADRESEAQRLWALLASGTLPGAETSADGGSARGEMLAQVAREVVGPSWKDGAVSPEDLRDRLRRLVTTMVEVLDRCDRAVRDLNLNLRTHMMLEGRSGGTITGLKLEEPLRDLLARAVVHTGDLTQLERRLERLAKSGILVYSAHQASVARAREELKRRLDPGGIQREHGAKSWEAYRRLYHNELQDLGAEFEEQYVTKVFLQEYFAVLDKER